MRNSLIKSLRPWHRRQRVCKLSIVLCERSLSLWSVVIGRFQIRLCSSSVIPHFTQAYPSRSRTALRKPPVAYIAAVLNPFCFTNSRRCSRCQANLSKLICSSLIQRHRHTRRRQECLRFVDLPWRDYLAPFRLAPDRPAEICLWPRLSREHANR
jgi:hypothetical protein